MIRKILSIVTVLALASLVLITTGSVFAEQPTVVPCRFTADVYATTSQGNVWWSGNNSVLHVRRASAEWRLFMGPVVQIGTAESMIDFDFNTKTGDGNAVRTWHMTFFAPVYWMNGTPTGSPNPYGMGTLEAKEILKVTSIFGVVTGTGVMLPGDATGVLVATHGTGDFENAKLSADTVSKPYLLPNPPFPPGSWGYDDFIGWNGIPPPIATGILTFHD